MPLDPQAFAPNSDMDPRRKRLGPLLSNTGGLSQLVSPDAEDLSQDPLKGGAISSDVSATGTPSALATERVQRSPLAYESTPLLSGADRLGNALGEADRGEESESAAGTIPRGLSPTARNQALMGFFRPASQATQDTWATKNAADQAQSESLDSWSAGAGDRRLKDAGTMVGKKLLSGAVNKGLGALAGMDTGRTESAYQLQRAGERLAEGGAGLTGAFTGFSTDELAPGIAAFGMPTSAEMATMSQEQIQQALDALKELSSQGTQAAGTVAAGGPNYGSMLGSAGQALGVAAPLIAALQGNMGGVVQGLMPAATGLAGLTGVTGAAGATGTLTGATAATSGTSLAPGAAGAAAGAVAAPAVIAGLINQFYGQPLKEAARMREKRYMEQGKGAYNQVAEALMGGGTIEDLFGRPMQGEGIFGTGKVGDMLARVAGAGFSGEMIPGGVEPTREQAALLDALEQMGYNGGVLYPLDQVLPAPGGAGLASGKFGKPIEGNKAWGQIVQNIGSALMQSNPQLGANRQLPDKDALAQRWGKQLVDTSGGQSLDQIGEQLPPGVFGKYSERYLRSKGWMPRQERVSAALSQPGGEQALIQNIIDAGGKSYLPAGLGSLYEPNSQTALEGALYMLLNKGPADTGG